MLKHGHFQASGPLELTTLINAIATRVQEPGKRGAMIHELYKSWFVECSVSGKQIPLNKLKYWNVDSQEVFASCHEATQRYIEINKDKT